MTFKLSDYLNTINQEYPQWYGWGRIDGDREVYSNLIVNHPGAVKPTEQECINGVASLQFNWDANQYQRDRASEYPSWQDQLDDIFHNGLEHWKSSIQAVKTKYPKP